MRDLPRVVEALLFLSPEPLSVEVLADACEAEEHEVAEALARLREHYAEGWRGVVLRELAGGFTLATDPVAERAARSATGSVARVNPPATSRSTTPRKPSA